MVWTFTLVTFQPQRRWCHREGYVVGLSLWAVFLQYHHSNQHFQLRFIHATRNTQHPRKAQNTKTQTQTTMTIDDPQAITADGHFSAGRQYYFIRPPPSFQQHPQPSSDTPRSSETIAVGTHTIYFYSVAWMTFLALLVLRLLPLRHLQPSFRLGTLSIRY